MRVSEKYPNGTHKDGHLCLHNLILKLERVEKHFSIDNSYNPWESLQFIAQIIRMLLTPSSWARTERKDYEIKTIRVINLFIFFRVHLSVFRRHETFIMRFFSPRSSWIPLHSRSLFFYRTLCELARLRSDDEKKINISFQSALEIK